MGNYIPFYTCEFACCVFHVQICTSFCLLRKNIVDVFMSLWTVLYDHIPLLSTIFILKSLIVLDAFFYVSKTFIHSKAVKFLKLKKDVQRTNQSTSYCYFVFHIKTGTFVFLSVSFLYPNLCGTSEYFKNFLHFWFPVKGLMCLSNAFVYDTD